MKNKVQSLLAVCVASTLVIVALNGLNIRLIDNHIKESFQGISQQRGRYAQDLEEHGLRDMEHLKEVIKEEVRRELE